VRTDNPSAPPRPNRRATAGRTFNRDIPMPLIRATDARSWKACTRRVWYDHYPPRGWRPPETEEFDTLTAEAGNQHERAVLRRLEATDRVVPAESQAHTVELMREGVPIIYQPRLERDDIIGYPDFLIRNASGDYQTADAKLKRDIDPHDPDDQAVMIQIGVYRRLLGNGLPGRVFLGSGREVEIGEEADPLTDEFIASMRALLDSTALPPARHGATKCGKCPYRELCLPDFTARGELTLLAQVARPAAESLERQGIHTITELAETDPTEIPKIPWFREPADRVRAVLQARAYRDDRYFVVERPSLPAGTWVHFDIETNPLSPSGQEHVYLWGLLLPPYETSDSFHTIWTDSEEDDRVGWRAFLDEIAGLRHRVPDLILAHYSPFERQKIALYAQRYDMAGHPIVEWLCGGESPLFDLCKLVKNSLVLPTKDYSLKTVCKHPNLFDFQWKDAGSGSQWSVVQYVRFLRSGDSAERARLKADILQYNLDDVRATRAVENWLRSLSDWNGPEEDDVARVQHSRDVPVRDAHAI
jgi:predicted RecB family nuclease